MINLYHVCTDGLKTGLIFKSADDFIYGMNGVAIFAHKFCVRILAFCLMNNHVHFVLNAPVESCTYFIKSMQLRLSRISKAAEADICIKEITDRDYLKKLIGYVLRNPVAAGIQLMPTNYPWGSGQLYFQSPFFFNLLHERCRRAGDMSSTELRSCLRSKDTIPDDYLINEAGMVLPDNYVDIRQVEQTFYSVRYMLFFLSKNEDMEMELTNTVMPKCRYDDEQLRSSMIELCRKEFNVRNISKLSVEDLFRLAGMLRKKYRAGARQIARVTGLSLTALKHIFGE